LLNEAMLYSLVACRLIPIVFRARSLHIVMAGLVPAIHVFSDPRFKAWMPGTSPGMTSQNS
jgi:hypothetical protein